jgi:hypothetical protein
MPTWTKEQIDADYWETCARDAGLTVENWKLLKSVKAELSNQEGIVSRNVFDRGDWLDESIRESLQEMAAQQEKNKEFLSNGLRDIEGKLRDLDDFYCVRIVEIGDKMRSLPAIAQKALQTSIIAGAGWIIALLLAVYIWLG